MKTIYFTLYNNKGKKKGEITRVISCSTDNVRPPPKRPGESRIKGRGDSITQKVVNRKIVDKTPAEMEALRRDNPKFRFDSGE